jgi:hypothetical protein
MCAEMPAEWRKSSRSLVNNCVEVADLGTAVGVRDSKAECGPELLFDTDAWRMFVEAVQRRSFDR